MTTSYYYASPPQRMRQELLWGRCDILSTYPQFVMLQNTSPFDFSSVMVLLAAEFSSLLFLRFFLFERNLDPLYH